MGAIIRRDCVKRLADGFGGAGLDRATLWVCFEFGEGYFGLEHYLSIVNLFTGKGKSSILIIDIR